MKMHVKLVPEQQNRKKSMSEKVKIDTKRKKWKRYHKQMRIEILHCNKLLILCLTTFFLLKNLIHFDFMSKITICDI